MENDEQNNERQQCDGNLLHGLGKAFKYLQIHPYNTPRISTDKIEPIDASPTRPNPSLEADLPLITVATPTPNANMNGTVSGPVVTPPASNEIGTKLDGAKAATKKISA